MVRIAGHNTLATRKRQLIVSSLTTSSSHIPERCETIKYVTKCNSARRRSTDSLNENTTFQLASHPKHVTAKQNQVRLILKCKYLSIIIFF